MSKSTKIPKKIYLDYAASVGANPSSIHALGVNAKKNLENARLKVAGVLNASPREIIFTSGGTESNNLAIQGTVLAWYETRKRRSSRRAKFLSKPHIITTNIEHPSVLETCRRLEQRKLAQISIVRVEANGIVDPKKIKKVIKKNTVLVSVGYANNEIGTIQPIREIAKEIKHYRKGRKDFLPFFHTDAVQAVNYLDLNVEKLGVDLLSLSGSKIAEAGRIGVLYKKKSVVLVSMWGGGDQEYGLRPGTENLPEIIKFSQALGLAHKMKKKEILRLTKLRDYFFETLRKTLLFSDPRFSGIPTSARPFKKESFTPFIINGDLKNRLPNNLNITFPKMPSDLLVIELSAKGIMTSSKSACKSSQAGGSYVIAAIRPETKDQIGGVRFSLGRDTTKSNINFTVRALSQILTKMKKWYH